MLKFAKQMGFAAAYNSDDPSTLLITKKLN
jgi:hypothetical protein